MEAGLLTQGMISFICHYGFAENLKPVTKAQKGASSLREKMDVLLPVPQKLDFLPSPKFSSSPAVLQPRKEGSNTQIPSVFPLNPDLIHLVSLHLKKIKIKQSLLMAHLST